MPWSLSWSHSVYTDDPDEDTLLLPYLLCPSYTADYVRYSKSSRALSHTLPLPYRSSPGGSMNDRLDQRWRQNFPELIGNITELTGTRDSRSRRTFDSEFQ